MSNLDDFFAKKDKKKPAKKAESALKTTELFKVLDSAAQNVQWDDQDSDGGKSRRDIGTVLGDVLNPEEASKWADPIEEERHYDLSNLKIESLQSPDEYDTNNTAANADPSKTTKTWDIPKKKDVSAKQEEKIIGKSPVSDSPVNKEKPTASEAPKEVAASSDAAIKGENKETDEKKSTVESVEKPGPQQGAYIAPGMRNRLPETAPVNPAPTPKDIAKSSSDGGGSAYVPPHMRDKPKELEKTVLMSSSSGAPQPIKAPELDNEQQFPSLGGPAPKRK
ncbi:protein CDV3 homolog B-like [Paramacrobiotus metropolitanus]|uniref:protein CDV3 homolog B-like n=1 Tax=Paramacrobiotus metropolitanus TaxID=2943436 RepID=UPI0024464410|nr:protein CDV3 homolog B-like [Paramacrobiotus metropolitanus]